MSKYLISRGNENRAELSSLSVIGNEELINDLAGRNSDKAKVVELNEDQYTVVSNYNDNCYSKYLDYDSLIIKDKPLEEVERFEEIKELQNMLPFDKRYVINFTSDNLESILTLTDATAEKKQGCREALNRINDNNLPE